MSTWPSVESLRMSGIAVGDDSELDEETGNRRVTCQMCRQRFWRWPVWGSASEVLCIKCVMARNAAIDTEGHVVERLALPAPQEDQ